MKITRFFVTAVLFVFTAYLMACDAYHSANKSTSNPSASAQQTAQLQTARADNAKLEQAMALKTELAATFRIILDDVRDPKGQVVKGTVMAVDFKWSMSKAQRRAAKEKLTKFVALSGEILEIDARKGVYVTNTDRVIAARDAASGYLKSLETFEKIRGENFEPKPGSDSEAAYEKSQEI